MRTPEYPSQNPCHAALEYSGVISPKAVRIIVIQVNSITVCNYC